MDGDHTRASEPADLSKLLRGIRGDEVLLGRLIDNFLSDYPDRMEALRRVLADRAAEAVDHVAHGLRGSLIILGADEASALASKIEALGRAGNLDEAGEALGRLEAEIARLVAFLEHRRGEAP